jgi:integrase
MKLNDRTVTETRPILPKGKADAIIFDEDNPGFGLRLREGGSRTWIYQYWLGERSRRMTLGKWPKLGANSARELLDSLAAKVALGQDPAADKFESRARKETFQEIADAYLAAQAKRLKPRSLDEVRRHLKNHATALQNRPIANIQRRDVAELLTTIADQNGPVSANRTRSSVSAMFNWAMKAGLAEANPAAFTNKEGEWPRERVLEASELREIWAALPESDYGTIVKLLILTGQRRTGIGDLRWSEIDVRRRTIALPPERVKNGRAHTIPISKPVRSILKPRSRANGRDFVFGYGDGGFSGWSRCKERLDAIINAKRKKPMRPWTIHDLRRTAATMMANSGIQPHIVETILNHASGHKDGIAGVYNHAKYQEAAETALEKWGKRVLKIVGENVARKSGRAS